MSYVMIFDTETTSLEKPFCYDVGYIIMDTETFQIVEQKHYVIEQVWHNLPLFESAYYKEKRPSYISLMRAKKAILEKFGYVTQKLTRDISNYNISNAYAYNSDFDEKVFNFNCDWFKCINPFDNVAIHDIWGYASQYITNTSEYLRFCAVNQLFTDTGNYKGSAEAVYRFLTNDPTFNEQHMGLYDSQIEGAILAECIKRNAMWNNDYKVNKVLPRFQMKPFTIKVNNKIIYQNKYVKKNCRNDTYSFTIME